MVEEIVLNVILIIVHVPVLDLPLYEAALKHGAMVLILCRGVVASIHPYLGRITGQPET